MINALGNYIGYGEGLRPIITQGDATLVDITGSNYAYIVATFITGSTPGNQSFGSFRLPTQKQVQYLVVAGGGGGGFYGGGGGGGGYCTGSALIPANVTVTMLAGRGGIGAGANTIPADPTGEDGFNSILQGSFTNETTASLTTITAIGGGGGGFIGLGTGSFNDPVGGSGGGAGANNGNTSVSSSAIVGQGSPGGKAFATAGNATYGGGGGGGATGVGTDGTGGAAPGNGGPGIESTITGTLLSFSGGGGGGAATTAGIPQTVGTANAIGRGSAGGGTSADSTGGGGGVGTGEFSRGSGGSGVIYVLFNKTKTSLY